MASRNTVSPSIPDHARSQLLAIHELTVFSPQSGERVFDAKLNHPVSTCSKCQGVSQAKSKHQRDIKDIIPTWVKEKKRPQSTLRYYYHKYMCSDPGCNALFFAPISFAARKMQHTYRFEQFVALSSIIKPYRAVSQELDGFPPSSVEDLFLKWLASADKWIRKDMPAPETLGIFTVTVQGRRYTMITNPDKGTLYDILDHVDLKTQTNLLKNTDEETQLRDALSLFKEKARTKYIYIDPYDYIYNAANGNFPNATIYTNYDRICKLARDALAAGVNSKYNRKWLKLFQMDPKDLSPYLRRKKAELLQKDDSLRELDRHLQKLLSGIAGHDRKGAVEQCCNTLGCIIAPDYMSVAEYIRNNRYSLAEVPFPLQNKSFLPTGTSSIITYIEEQLSAGKGCLFPALRARAIYTEAAEKCLKGAILRDENKTGDYKEQEWVKVFRNTLSICCMKMMPAYSSSRYNKYHYLGIPYETVKRNFALADHLAKNSVLSGDEFVEHLTEE